MTVESRKNDTPELIREYRNLRGMSLSDGRAPDEAFAYLQNMYVDYEGGGGAVESIPGFRKIYGFDGEIHSAAIQTVKGDRLLIVHCGKELYRFAVEQRDNLGKLSPIAELDSGKSNIFAFGPIALISDGERLLRLDEQGGLSLVSEEKYIAACSLCAIYDDRIFLSGNPDFSGRIFYSSRLSEEKISFSEDSFITASSAGTEVNALLAYGGMLWIFKSADEGEGAILCYVAESEGYTLRRVFNGLCPTGQVCSCADKIIFLAEDGLFALEAPLSSERAKTVRLSSDIESMLLSENLKSAALTLWHGYIAIGCGEKIYLYDRRSADGCGWYFLTPIGGYKNDRRVYRYAHSFEEGYHAHPLTDEAAAGEVLSIITEDGNTVYYTEENKKKYSVYPTEQFEGGDFLPARRVFSDGRLLWFYTEGGGLYLFNSDKRGAAPESVKSSLSFDEEKYKRLYSRKIHPLFYSFDGHAPSYILITKPDCCGPAGVVKSSQGAPLCISLRDVGTRLLKVELIADGQRIRTHSLLPNTKRSRWERNGDEFCEGTSRISLCEQIPSWQEKQIRIESSEFCSPLGVRSVSFRYKMKDKFKKG